MAASKTATAEEQARQRAKGYTDMLWHAATYVIIMGFLWFIDLRSGGTDFAHWIAIFWGIALAFHVAYYFIAVSGGRRKYHKALAEERAASTSDQA